ncbi:MAG: hypothetical protein AB7J13_17325 [Pyrinomonadaceae bacterium]
MREGQIVDHKRELLTHYLAALAYRTQKSLRGAPDGFAGFQVGNEVRTPMELLRHMTSVLGYACTFFTGGDYWPEPLANFDDEVSRFHKTLERLARHLRTGEPFLDPMTAERMLQGPLADAMTHAGQLGMLRRLYGDPVPPENFIFAEITSNNLGPDQADPLMPDAEWPEAPKKV